MCREHLPQVHPHQPPSQVSRPKSHLSASILPVSIVQTDLTPPPTSGTSHFMAVMSWILPFSWLAPYLLDCPDPFLQGLLCACHLTLFPCPFLLLKRVTGSGGTPWLSTDCGLSAPQTSHPSGRPCLLHLSLLRLCGCLAGGPGPGPLQGQLLCSWLRKPGGCG